MYNIQNKEHVLTQEKQSETKIINVRFNAYISFTYFFWIFFSSMFLRDTYLLEFYICPHLSLFPLFPP